MKNPFLEKIEGTDKEFLTSKCSVNRVVLNKLPVYGVYDDAEGKTAYDIFSTTAVIEEIINSKISDIVDLSKIDDVDYARYLGIWLNGKNNTLAKIAMDIMKDFGNRLGLILLTLKLGEPENRACRSDWTDEHWEYWKNIKTVVLAGGLATGVQGKILKQQVEYVFSLVGEKPYDIIVFDNPSYAGVMGCVKKIKCSDGTHIVLDFGQTNIKRSIVKLNDGEIIWVQTLPSISSINMNSYDTSEKSAIQLHQYLVNAVAKTFREAVKEGAVGSEIVISIANYVKGDNLYSDRGGYGKLALIGEHYAKILEEDCSSELRQPVKITLIHDGTAMALWFSDYKDTVCLSLGTAFGVGFPEINV
ncbi:MAG: hypothetical protein Q8876_01630 [Bacillota bacterium]|nr:hypothetical protein [Bacillota bacterium]